MQTEAIFGNIAERIQQQISQAQHSIFIAVAWFTNKNLFDALVSKAENGCSVLAIISNDEINLNSKIDFEQLQKGSSKVYKIGNGDTELMHNKFCVIDHSTVITGSYNWSYKAERNFENVVITSGDTTLAEQFISEFNNIRKKYYPDAVVEEVDFPLSKIIRRMEIIKNYILLEDIDDLKQEMTKLEAYNYNADISEIISAIEKRELSSAISKIQNFISRNQQLTVWIDPVIAALKLEVKNLENQINAYDNEKTEMEKLLHEFQHRHTTELGEIILDILKLRKLKFRFDKEKLQEAEQDEKQYRQQFEAEKKKELFELTDDQKIELKKKFRKATVLCHPDKVREELKEAAQKFFIELKQAYDTNDLKKVSEILSELEKGNFFRANSDTINEKDLLEATISKLRRQVAQLEVDITAIKESETFQTVAGLEDWDSYFSRTKEQLEQELERLREEIKKTVKIKYAKEN